MRINISQVTGCLNKYVAVTTIACYYHHPLTLRRHHRLFTESKWKKVWPSLTQYESRHPTIIRIHSVVKFQAIDPPNTYWKYIFRATDFQMMLIT